MKVCQVLSNHFNKIPKMSKMNNPVNLGNLVDGFRVGERYKRAPAGGLKGFSVSAMKNHRTFYLCYPQISQSVIGLLQSAYSQNGTILQIDFPVKSQSVSGFLEVTEEKDIWLT